MAATKPTVGVERRKAPEGYVNLSARYPKYEFGGIDIKKKENVDAFAPVVNGYALGRLVMPSTQVDPETGELKPWEVLVIELLEPCPAYLEEDGTQMRPAGTRIIFTITTAVESAIGRNSLDAALMSHESVAKVFIQPQLSRVKMGKWAGKPLWIYPEFSVHPKLDARRPDQIVSLAGAAVAPQLPAAQENGTGIRPALPAHAAAG